MFGGEGLLRLLGLLPGGHRVAVNLAERGRLPNFHELDLFAHLSQLALLDADQHLRDGLLRHLPESLLVQFFGDLGFAPSLSREVKGHLFAAASQLAWYATLASHYNSLVQPKSEGPEEAKKRSASTSRTRPVFADSIKPCLIIIAQLFCSK